MTVAQESLPARLRTTPQQARSQARINDALAAAMQLLETEGPDAITTTRVATAAGMAVGSVYRYFPDRDAILYALAARYLDDFTELVEGMVELAGTETWDDPVGLLIDATAEVYRTRPGMRALWFRVHHSEELLEQDRAHTRLMGKALERIIVAQRIPYVGDLESACYACLLVTDVLMKEAFRENPDGDPGLLEQTKAILRAYLQSATR